MLPAVAARPAAGLREMMVEEGGADKEGGGGSPSGSGLLQQIGMLRLGACGRAAAATHRGRIGSTRGHEVIVASVLWTAPVRFRVVLATPHPVLR